MGAHRTNGRAEREEGSFEADDDIRGNGSSAQDPLGPIPEGEKGKETFAGRQSASSSASSSPSKLFSIQGRRSAVVA